MIFRRFPTTFRRLPKIFKNCSEGPTNVPEHFPKISENFRRLLKTFEEDPKMFRTRDKLDISEIIDIFTFEDIISSHVRILYRFYQFVTTQYTTDFFYNKGCLCTCTVTLHLQYVLDQIMTLRYLSYIVSQNPHILFCLGTKISGTKNI